MSGGSVQIRAAEILEFFVTHPDAVETLEGITEWRFMEELIRRRVAETDAALRWLVDAGFLTRFERGGGTPLYRLLPERHLDAVRFVEDAAQASPSSGGGDRER